MSDELYNEIARRVYPAKWVTSGKLRIDNNCGKRHVARDVAKYFLETLHERGLVEEIMKAFYRREHGREPNPLDITLLTSQMGTALLAYEIKLGGTVE
jgi:hypothetical protein